MWNINAVGEEGGGERYLGLVRASMEVAVLLRAVVISFKKTRAIATSGSCNATL